MKQALQSPTPELYAAGVAVPSPREKDYAYLHAAKRPTRMVWSLTWCYFSRLVNDGDRRLLQRVDNEALAPLWYHICGIRAGKWTLRLLVEMA